MRLTKYRIDNPGPSHLYPTKGGFEAQRSSEEASEQMAVGDDEMKDVEYGRGRKRKLAARSRSPSTDKDSRSVRTKQEGISEADVNIIGRPEEQEEEEDTTANRSTASDAATYLRQLLLELPESHPKYGEVKQLAQFLACLTNSQDVVMLE